MALTNPSLPTAHQEAADPFAMQLALSTVHARLVPMRRGERGYEHEPVTSGWYELPAGRGFAGYGLGRALRMLLDVLRGLTALHDTFDAMGETFAHGDVSLTQLRVDPEGVCRLVPLTARHSLLATGAPALEALGYLAPERLLGEAVDVRSDVFSAGALLWEALAGRRLVEETTGDAIIERMMGEKLQMPQLPPELAWAIPLKAVAARALSVDPYQRFADCAELATAIAIVARERVASHAEIARFFGAPPLSVERRSLESVHPGPEESQLSALFIPSSGPRTPVKEGPNVGPLPSQRPVPTRSSTFPTVNAPSSRRTSTLAPLGPARSLTPPPSARATPVPSTRAASRSAPRLSPFSTLLSAESRPSTEARPSSFPPASEPARSGRRTSTLLSFGVPSPIVEPSLEAPPESADAPRSSSRPPPLPPASPLPPFTQVPSFPVPLSSPSKPEPLAARPLVVPSVRPDPKLAHDEKVRFQPWPARRIWSVALLITLAVAVAVIVFMQSRASGEVATSNAATPAVPVAAKPVAGSLAPAPDALRPNAPEPAPVAPDQAVAPVGAAPSASSPHTPATKAALKAGKDYGI